MAANFLPGHYDLFKIFSNSGSEDEFEGFDPEDVEEDVMHLKIFTVVETFWTYTRIGALCFLHHLDYFHA